MDNVVENDETEGSELFLGALKEDFRPVSFSSIGNEIYQPQCEDISEDEVFEKVESPKSR